MFLLTRAHTGEDDKFIFYNILNMYDTYQQT